MQSNKGMGTRVVLELPLTDAAFPYTCYCHQIHTFENHKVKWFLFLFIKGIIYIRWDLFASNLSSFGLRIYELCLSNDQKENYQKEQGMPKFNQDKTANTTNTPRSVRVFVFPLKAHYIQAKERLKGEGISDLKSSWATSLWCQSSMFLSYLSRKYVKAHTKREAQHLGCFS